MSLDAQTLFFSLMVNVVLMSTALAVQVRWTPPSGIHAWTGALVLQALAWGALIIAHRHAPRAMATVGVAGLTGAMALMHTAASAYLQEPASRAWRWGAQIATTVVHWLVYPSYVAGTRPARAGRHGQPRRGPNAAHQRLTAQASTMAP